MSPQVDLSEPHLGCLHPDFGGSSQSGVALTSPTCPCRTACLRTDSPDPISQSIPSPVIWKHACFNRSSHLSFISVPPLIKLGSDTAGWEASILWCCGMGMLWSLRGGVSCVQTPFCTAGYKQPTPQVSRTTTCAHTIESCHDFLAFVFQMSTVMGQSTFLAR